MKKERNKRVRFLKGENRIHEEDKKTLQGHSKNQDVMKEGSCRVVLTPSNTPKNLGSSNEWGRKRGNDFVKK